MQEHITDIQIKRVQQPKQLKVFEISYMQKGQRVTKEVVKSMNVVKILLYHEEKDAFVLVKQFRPLIYINHPESAFRYELCGGKEDKLLSSIETAKEEVYEECGYDIPTEALKKVAVFTTTSRITLYYAKINESARAHSGGGVDDEMIELYYLPVSKAMAFIQDETKPNRPTMAYAICWFLQNKISTR